MEVFRMVSEFPILGQYQLSSGCVTLAGIDSVEIALANLLTGVSHREPQDKTIVLDGAKLENIIAIPAVPMMIDDESARQFALLEDLIGKVKRLRIPDDRVALMLTGRVSSQISAALQSQFSQSFVAVRTELTLSASIEAMEELSEQSDVEHWLWISVHAGCSARNIAQMGGRIATNLTSEYPMPADAAVAVVLSRTQNSKASFVKRAVEVYADDPLSGPVKALSTMFSGWPEIHNSVLIHNLPNTAEGNIEVYKFEQQLDEQRPEYEDVVWMNNVPARYNLSSIFGDVGVCNFPLLMQLHSAWLGDDPVNIIATENQWRFTWSFVRS
jgi:hypothetical protein